MNNKYLKELKEEGNLVAVYGTLKKKYGNHRVMEYAKGEYIKDDWIEFKSLDSGGFPLVKFEEGTDKLLKVEIYSVSKKGIEKQLDVLEGNPTFYIRKEVTTVGGDKVTVYEIVRDIVDISEKYKLKSDTDDFSYYEWDK